MVFFSLPHCSSKAGLVHSNLFFSSSTVVISVICSSQSKHISCHHDTARCSAIGFWDDQTEALAVHHIQWKKAATTSNLSSRILFQVQSGSSYEMSSYQSAAQIFPLVWGHRSSVHRPLLYQTFFSRKPPLCRIWNTCAGSYFAAIVLSFCTLAEPYPAIGF